MVQFIPGSFVCHSKLPELESGEVIASEKGTLRIRFASGERSFSLEKAAEHLEVTLEAPKPAPSAKVAKKASKKKVAKPLVSG